MTGSSKTIKDENMDTKTFKQRHFICLLQYSRFDSVIFLPPQLIFGVRPRVRFLNPQPPPINFVNVHLFRVRLGQKISGPSAAEGQTIGSSAAARTG